jgi:glucose-6-phosphate 1-dehydrogenase
LGKLFKEEQIFRIDHYLAKEALQNIIAFRSTNPIFAPLWNNRYIDKIHIKLFEKMGMEGRGPFYDPIGALKDVGQNHMLQMLALITMSEPRSLKAEDIRRERFAILKSLNKIAKNKIAESVVRGQYQGYLAEPGVRPQSTTETYFRIATSVKSARWKGVPIYLENGKAMEDSKTEIDVYFKTGKKRPIVAKGGEKTNSPENQNIITFRIQPDEGIKIKFFVKTPGLGFATEPKTLKFKYSDVAAFNIIHNDYERLIHDAFLGDQTLFASTAEIMASWEFVTPIVENWSKLPLTVYEKGAREVS